MCTQLTGDRPGPGFRKVPPNWVLGCQAPPARVTEDMPLKYQIVGKRGTAGAARGWGGDGEEPPGKRPQKGPLGWPLCITGEAGWSTGALHFQSVRQCGAYRAWGLVEAVARVGPGAGRGLYVQGGATG